MLSQHGSGDAESWYWERLDICHIAAKMDSNRLRNDIGRSKKWPGASGREMR